MKVGVVGCGAVGSSGAYALALNGTANEIVLIDLDQKLAQALLKISCTRFPSAYPYG